MRRLSGIGLLLALGACDALPQGCRGAIEPQVHIASATVASWGLDGALIDIEADVANPIPLALTVSAIPCDLTIGGEPLGTATIPAGTTLRPLGTTRVAIPLRAPAPALAALAMQGLTRGSTRPYQLRCTLRVSLPGGAALEVPVERSGFVDLVRRELLRPDRTPEVVKQP